ncbi:MAG: ATP-binding protein [Methylocella sp.]
MHEHLTARGERRLRARQTNLNAGKLPIDDELGYAPFTALGSELLFEVFIQHYETCATLVTSCLLYDASRSRDAAKSRQQGMAS